MTFNLSLYAELPETNVLGPGCRYAIWVQGCPFDCPGCMSQSTRPFAGGYIATVQELTKRILATKTIEGLTLSGGEPFAHAAGLAALVRSVRAERDLGVIAYSGYTLKEIRKKAVDDSAVAALLAELDVLIDGRFQETFNDGGRWRGSANQQLHCFTPRYREAMDKEFGQRGRSVELHLGHKEWLLAGVPGKDALTQWRRMTIQKEIL